MKPDPHLRKDGLCAVCRKPRKIAKNRLKDVDPMIYERDPFCSTECAKKWHGYEIGKVAA